MNLFDNPLVCRPQLVLHLHRLHYHQSPADLDHLAWRYFHAHDEPRHRRFDNTAGDDLAPLTGQRLDLLGAVVLNLDLDPFADRPEGPATGVELLAGHGPRVLAQEQVKERCPWDSSTMCFERFAIDGHRAASDVDDVGAGTERDVVPHYAASSTATVSTCPVCGHKSNARTSWTT